jgi:hypothetical protein
MKATMLRTVKPSVKVSICRRCHLSSCAIIACGVLRECYASVMGVFRERYASVMGVLCDCHLEREGGAHFEWSVVKVLKNVIRVL